MSYAFCSLSLHATDLDPYIYERLLNIQAKRKYKRGEKRSPNGSKAGYGLLVFHTDAMIPTSEPLNAHIEYMQKLLSFEKNTTLMIAFKQRMKSDNVNMHVSSCSRVGVDIPRMQYAETYSLQKYVHFLGGTFENDIA